MAGQSVGSGNFHRSPLAEVGMGQRAGTLTFVLGGVWVVPPFCYPSLSLTQLSLSFLETSCLRFENSKGMGRALNLDRWK